MEGREDKEGREDVLLLLLLLLLLLRLLLLLLDTSAVALVEGWRNLKGRGGGREEGREEEGEEEEERGVRDRGARRRGEEEEEGGRAGGVRGAWAERASQVKSWARGEEGKKQRTGERGWEGEQGVPLPSGDEGTVTDGDPIPSLPPSLPLLLPGVLIPNPSTPLPSFHSSPSPSPTLSPSPPSSSSTLSSHSLSLRYKARKKFSWNVRLCGQPTSPMWSTASSVTYHCPEVRGREGGREES